MTQNELSAIKQLVVTMCANYDHDYSCLPLGCVCVMLKKIWISEGCKYFNKCLLPLNNDLMISLANDNPVTRVCPVCDETFVQNGKQIYCSNICAGKIKQKQQRGYMRKRRGMR